ncbi:methylenetetrahydrofolate reductase (NADPH) [Arthrobacter alpinus]|uniref:Methylenetetrahydrofolate reductase n=1 Tax=Arthrobacter alpinus TaxID=656366 RepID=A0A1H5DPC6_9MICC|nr:methylenetetrahydrofolate reductase [Arthrobacter alpinus]SED80580.1 methylenetetrahydrofolate reductase (NADPH) [Arthrobacter alpinus]
MAAGFGADSGSGLGDPAEQPALPSRVEIIPTAGIVESVVAQLPAGTTVTVTCLPNHGIERTVAASLELAGHGYNVVPHLAARSIGSREQLASILRDCRAAGIAEVFAIGGDKAQAAGPYDSSDVLVRDIAELGSGNFRIGVAGYPEGHPNISDQQLLDSLRAKADVADRIVTQMCFSAELIGTYAAMLRTEGITIPVWAGVAGFVPRTKLISLATKIGVGSSLRFISGKGALGLRLMGGTRYNPDALVAELTALPTPPAGIHLYSFNNVGSHAPVPA